MTKPIQIKRMVPLLLPVVLIIGVLFFYYHGKALKASAPDSLVSVTVKNKAVPNDSLETDKETVELSFKAKDTDIFELSYDDTVSIVPLNEEGQDIAYPQLDSSDFKKSQALGLFEKRLETVKTSEQESSKELMVSEGRERFPYYQVHKSESKGSFYFELEKNQVQHLRITRLTRKEQTVTIKSLKDNNKTQPIVLFKTTEQLNQAQTKIPETIEPVENERQEEFVEPTNSGSDNTEGQINKSPKSENEDVKEERTADSAAEEKTIDSRAVSGTTPFRVSIDVGRTTGVAPFDTTKAPGYDRSADDEFVRTWDIASYRVNIGISNMDVKYTSLRIRLDTELSDSWRKDSAGQIRQTAELSNGTVTDTGNGTKKSNRSSWLTLSKATGQAYFTETIETFGGVNGDSLKPEFTVTIESAKTTSGGTETIDQVINASVEPHLKDEIFISAKPLVDVKMVWSPNSMTTFNQLASSTDHPYTMVSNVAAYVQLKPLPGRTDIGLLKGSTYPVGGVRYDINQKLVYSEDHSDVQKELEIGTDTRGMQAIMYDGLYRRDQWSPNKQVTAEYVQYEPTLKELSRSGMAAPAGYTRRIYPPTQTSPNNNIGIYDTGKPKAINQVSDNSIRVENQDYTPISVGPNKWFVNGGKMASNAEPFSVINMAMTFPYEYLEKQVDINANIDYQLTVSKIKYEGVEQDVNSKISMAWDRKWPGSMITYAVFMDKNRKAYSSNHDTNFYKSSGDGVVAKGEKIYLRSATSAVDFRTENAVQYTRWNANSFEYDSSRSIIQTHTDMDEKAIYFGVGNNVPDVSLREQEEIDKAYSWYSSATEAEKNGTIAAIKTVTHNTSASGVNSIRVWVPLTVVGTLTEEDGKGNGNIGLTNTMLLDNEDKSVRISPGKGKNNYAYTKYNDSGVITEIHNPSGDYGDTLYITPMTIRPTITSDKSVYSPQEVIRWSVEGKVESGSSQNHKVKFAVTIPEETHYADGTAKDYLGKQLSDPVIKDNSDGTQTLTWILDYLTENSSYNPKVSFDTIVISSKLNFINNVADLDGKVVADLWLESDENNKDTSEEEFRTSTKTVSVSNSGVIVVDKEVNKPYIESGNEVDPAKPSITHPTDFTYTISYKNHSAVAMNDIRVLDVLPYNGDGRGTDFNGDYSLLSTKLGNGSGVIWYTNNSFSANVDPNSIVLSSGWYKLGSDMSVLKNAKAVMAIYDEVQPDEDLSFSITLRPDKQKAGDKYVNAPSLNSHLNKFVQGVPSRVTVYGRDLSGVAWYDDSLDGLIGNKSSGAPEDWVKDIPVKLYRTSLEVPSYKKKLVEESLTGEKFINGSGDSLVKTDANGKYLFENLPEGDYIAEFIIGDKVVQREARVTKQLVGSDPTKNSKADQDSYQTLEYEQPSLSEIAGSGATDAKHHVTDVNLGLIRPSTIRLFKYATGTATDANGDGELSEAEKATGTPLSGAEFEVYEGDASTPFATETTDGSGYLNFVKLFPGEHTLIETKAPSGYELIKNPIKVTITEGNQTVTVYQENDKKADLPFTGGTKALRIILIASVSLFVIGMAGVFLHFRPIKVRGGN
ncbi:SpaA isopeptide-forming pilin-related protein [Enterococcus sp. DIV0187]|uniref:SpaA isopeptide-forming pilin-related protein n=1 Tax=Enterococcus sp. DIV0187 TaxID=2774644 RepID=UPI003F1E6F42